MIHRCHFHAVAVLIGGHLKPYNISSADGSSNNVKLWTIRIVLCLAVSVVSVPRGARQQTYEYAVSIPFARSNKTATKFKINNVSCIRKRRRSGASSGLASGVGHGRVPGAAALWDVMPERRGQTNMHGVDNSQKERSYSLVWNRAYSSTVTAASREWRPYRMNPLLFRAKGDWELVRLHRIEIIYILNPVLCRWIKLYQSSVQTMDCLASGAP